jgi:hypothetical protein
MGWPSQKFRFAEEGLRVFGILGPDFVFSKQQCIELGKEAKKLIWLELRE